MTTPQPGIFAQGTRCHRHLEFALRPDVPTDQVRSALAGLAQPSSNSAGANVVVGFGAALWKRLDDRCPPTIAELAVEGMPSTPRDVWIWLHGPAEDVLLDAARAFAVALAPAADLTVDQACFAYHDSRDLMGFVDGTENPPVERAAAVAVIPSGPGAGGSHALTQRWVHDLAAFAQLSVTEQEAVIGRTKPDSVELVGDALLPSSHVARTAVRDATGAPLEIYRRSAPYGTVAEHGLHFVAFAADPEPLLVQLDRMAGNVDGVRDAIMRFSTPVTGARWFVPSLEDLERALA